MKNWTRVAMAAGVLCCASLATAQDDSKALVERVCTKCHELDATQRQRNNKERWTEIVDDMVSRGAEATDKDVEKIITFLSTAYGPKINVNKADADQLTSVLEIPKSAAAAIVEYREKNGGFKTVDDLKKVAGVDAKEIEIRKERFVF